MRGRAKIFRDSFQHCVSLKQDLIIPESQHAKSKTLKLACPTVIRFHGFCMLPAVYLDHKPVLKTAEVNDVDAYRMLPSKLRIKNLPTTKAIPEKFLGIRLLPTEIPGMAAR